MPPKSESITIVALLNRLTQENKLKWDACEPNKELLSGTDDRIDTVYVTQFKGRRLGVYIRKFQDYIPDLDTMYWNSEVVVAFLHEDSSIALKLSGLGSAASDLLESIQIQDVNLDEFLEELRKEKDRQ